MHREASRPRPDWPARCEQIGFAFHSLDGYWREDVRYRFGAAEIDELEAATAELHGLYLAAVEHVVRARAYERFAIPEPFLGLIEASWEADGEAEQLELYGRFDLAYAGAGPPILLEYNADTPTTCIEMLAQWVWLEDLLAAGELPAGADQFNSFHERMIERWRDVARRFDGDLLHLACQQGSLEDWCNVAYLGDLARQVGLDTKIIDVGDIGWDAEAGVWRDGDEVQIRNLFCLYPKEWLMREAFGPHLLLDRWNLVEPMWKALVANKAMLPVLWALNEGHPNLAPAYYDAGPLRSGLYVRKPVLSREGANVTVYSGSLVVEETGGGYGGAGFVHQRFAPLFEAGDGRHCVLGAWAVGPTPAGITVREFPGLVSTNLSNFVPHYLLG